MPEIGKMFVRKPIAEFVEKSTIPDKIRKSVLEKPLLRNELTKIRWRFGNELRGSDRFVPYLPECSQMFEDIIAEFDEERFIIELGYSVGAEVYGKTLTEISLTEVADRMVTERIDNLYQCLIEFMK